MFDEDNTGSITVKNLRKIAKEIGELISDAELDEMIEKARGDNSQANKYDNKSVSFEDFYNLMTKKNY